MANDWEDHFPSPAQCEKIKTKFCRHRYGLKGGDGPSLASPIRHLRILLLACHQLKLRSKAVKGLCHTLIYAEVPRLVRFWRISWARLPEQNLIHNLLQDGALPKDDQMGHESLPLLAHPRDSQVKRCSWAPRNPVQNIKRLCYAPAPRARDPLQELNYPASQGADVQLVSRAIAALFNEVPHKGQHLGHPTPWRPPKVLALR